MVIENDTLFAKLFVEVIVFDGGIGGGELGEGFVVGGD